MKNKIVFGVCGIGRGHIHRQLPLINYYIQNSLVAIFAFGESYDYFNNLFDGSDNVAVFCVSVPWIHGHLFGVDFEKTGLDQLNTANSFISENFLIMDKTLKFLGGKPDVVISDYEPVSAQFSYSLFIPLITVDQQSKYFFSGYPKILSGLSPNEEVGRLGLFFPKAKLRIATSYFKSPSKKTVSPDIKVKIVGPIIGDKIVEIKRKNISVKNNVILVYLSPYSPFLQNPNEVFEILKQFPRIEFHLFVSRNSVFWNQRNTILEKVNNTLDNIYVYLHGDQMFLKILEISIGCICTGGHTFISELIYLNKPAYVIPLMTYEQNYNSKVIGENNFGIEAGKIDLKKLKYFLENIQFFKKNIVKDRVFLNKKMGQGVVIKEINKIIKTSK